MVYLVITTILVLSSSPSSSFYFHPFLGSFNLLKLFLSFHLRFLRLLFNCFRYFFLAFTTQERERESYVQPLWLFYYRIILELFDCFMVRVPLVLWVLLFLLPSSTNNFTFVIIRVLFIISRCWFSFVSPDFERRLFSIQ